MEKEHRLTQTSNFFFERVGKNEKDLVYVLCHKHQSGLKYDRRSLTKDKCLIAEIKVVQQRARFQFCLAGVYQHVGPVCARRLCMKQ